MVLFLTFASQPSHLFYVLTRALRTRAHSRPKHMFMCHIGRYGFEFEFALRDLPSRKWGPWYVTIKMDLQLGVVGRAYLQISVFWDSERGDLAQTRVEPVEKNISQLA